MNRFTITLVVLAAAMTLVAALLWIRQRGPDPQPSPEPLPPLLQIPAAYRAEAKGTLVLDDMSVPGLARMHYLVYPDDRVRVSKLVVWMDDLDLVVDFVWWEVKREPLRCTTFRGEGIHGVLQGDQLIIPAGAELVGHSFLARGTDGKCRGKARTLKITTTEEIRAVHRPEDNLDPEGNRFAISASLDATFDGNELTIALQATGHYVNRPPIARLEVSGEGDIVTATDGCPVNDKGLAVANHEDGLLVKLRSNSYDPDGVWPPGSSPKLMRVDLSWEQWARSRPEGLTFLGAGREIGPVLFETGREHQLLLWVTDRKGAEARRLCRFEVVANR